MTSGPLETSATSHVGTCRIAWSIIWLLSRGKQRQAITVHKMRHGTASQGTDGYYLSHPCAMAVRMSQVQDSNKGSFCTISLAALLAGGRIHGHLIVFALP